MSGSGFASMAGLRETSGNATASLFTGVSFAAATLPASPFATSLVDASFAWAIGVCDAAAAGFWAGFSLAEREKDFQKRFTIQPDELAFPRPNTTISLNGFRSRNFTGRARVTAWRRLTDE